MRPAREGAASRVIAMVAVVLGGVGAALAPCLVYIVLLLGTSSGAYKLQGWGPRWRWFCGLLCATVLSGFKTAVLIPALLPGTARGATGSGSWDCGTLGGRIILYALTALWECSNASLVFGGSELLQRLGITTQTRALVAGLAPCQIKFITCGMKDDVEQRSALTVAVAAAHVKRATSRSLHIALCFVAWFCLRHIVLWWPSAWSPERTAVVGVVLETEALAIFLSVFVVAVLDAPSHLWQLGANPIWRYFSSTSAGDMTGDTPTRIEAILPYGAVYLSTSARDFWGKWSRPATQLIRRMVYYPLGGRRRPYWSIPLLFAINGASHYDVGRALVGQRKEGSWNTVFGVLGLAATLEVLATNFLTARVEARMEMREGLVPYGRVEQQQDVVMLPRWFRIARGIFAHASIRVALHVFVHRCLEVNVRSLLLGAAE